MTLILEILQLINVNVIKFLNLAMISIFEISSNTNSIDVIEFGYYHYFSENPFKFFFIKQLLKIKLQ